MMAIPDFQSCMIPILRTIADGAEYSMKQVADTLAIQFDLSEQEKTQMLPSGRQELFYNRVAWAKFYLSKAELILSPKRGSIKISEAGIKLLSEKVDYINLKYLKRFPAYVAFKELTKSESENDLGVDEQDGVSQTPEELLESAHQKIKKELAQDVLAKILACSPTFFESLVVELLVKMGYGGSRKDAGQRVGQTSDGGIDGIIKEDRLGLDTIYIQAKRWQGGVGRPEIQKFVGALQGQRAKKGVFITTSYYTQEAKEYVSYVDTKVVLIDGQLLADLMIDFDVGVSPAATYVVKKIDTDYFEEV